MNMPLKLEEISPENELQQNLEQLNIVDNDGYECDVDDNLRESEEGKPVSYNQGQDRKPTLDDNTNDKKNWNDESTCRSEDGSHEIGSNITNDNEKDEKDVTSSVDESDFSLPKHRKDYPSDDERTDSESLSNEEEDLVSEESSYRPQKYPSSSKVYNPYEQITPTRPSNTQLQVNGVNVPFEISPMSLGDNSPQDDIDVARIINPIMRSIADLKSEFRTQLAKFHYYPDPNLSEIKVDENWQYIEFEKAQDQHQYDAIVTAGKLIDVIMPLQLPEEAKEHLAQARNILWEKSLLYCTPTENIDSSGLNHPQAAYDIDPATVDSAFVTPSDNDVESGTEFVPSNVKDNDKLPEENRSSVQAENGSEFNYQTSATTVNKTEDQTSTVADGTTKTNNESSNNSNATSSHKYQRGSSQGRKLRRHTTRGASAYSPKSSRRGQNYSPRTPNVRSPRVGSTVTSSIAGSATNVLQANNRRFVGFLPSRCFTCGGIGHFASTCPNKGSYITTSTSNNQTLSRRRRPNTSRFRRTPEFVGNNSTSNE